MGFFKKVFKVAAPIIGGIVAGPVGAAIGSGVGTLATGGTPIQALASGAGSYLGGSLLNTGAGGATVGSSLGSTGLGGALASALPSSVLGANLGQATGQFLGGSLGEMLAANGNVQGQRQYQTQSVIPQQKQFTPVKPAALALPSTLGDMAGMSDIQQSTNLATRGVEGQGLGSAEQNYFTNLIQRRLQDDSGGLKDISNVNPIENQYLTQRMGLNYGQDTRSLLEALAGAYA